MRVNASINKRKRKIDVFNLFIKVRLFPLKVHRLFKLNLIPQVGTESKILKQSKLQEVRQYSEACKCLFINVRRDGTLRVGYNHPITNKREWKNCFIENTHKVSRILFDFIVKTTDFQLAIFQQTRTVRRAW